LVQDAPKINFSGLICLYQDYYHMRNFIKTEIFRNAEMTVDTLQISKKNQITIDDDILMQLKIVSAYFLFKPKDQDVLQYI